ncbi:HD domain containing protein [Trichomonas vaginalis G3]|uniref:HD domain containing protein n=1 Tax=Trichomonas vaginalis (strain ATCC PRA-98 / G3) TaxID=412133 RepID=A2DE84_TRIV3|nr:metal dependent phosphohydrolases with conserved 'HD' motif family [Trichomonas vaginalis G3]EAY21302.1 HD domain containing protein [Trichomonas vaginalis G3]KAI5548960.1 metal dependent phosphohydrolases with conserved 'HD' motif family [Trichomonas vaginalis G3]|eukprot:XP_001582288.1 HD domain containing protein [Trichomonas vaginalis G3]
MDLEAVEAYMVQKMGSDSSGHDYFHALRVRNTALSIAKHENSADIEVVVCAALLHDVPDPKVCKSIPETKLECKQVLARCGMDEKRIEHVMHIIETLGFKGNIAKREMDTLEGKIVQDADRLDAIGAIGVARAFAFGGANERLMWDPSIAPQTYKNEAEYRSAKSSTLNHFDEKLLLIKDLMQTESGKKVAELRHKYLADFKQKFIDEWYGNDIKEVLE